MISRFRLFFLGCTILILLFGLVGPAGPGLAVANEPKVDPAVLAQLDRDGQGTFLVYLAAQADLTPAYQIRDWNERGWYVYNALREVADRTQPAVLQALDTLQVSGHVTAAHPYYIVNLIVVHGDAEAARTIARRPDVAAVYPEMKIELVEPVAQGPSDPGPQAVEWNIAKIGADQVWATYGVTGTGAVVANIDTGVDYTHPALVRQYRGNLGGGNFDHNYNWWDATFVYPYPYPYGTHGTHVMGTEVGDDGAGNQIGVAPGARWIAAYGCCPDNEALLSATQWMIAPTDLTGSNPDPSKRPDAVNNSWGGPGGSEIFNGLIAAQRASGIFPAFSAGNNGAQCGTLGSPGDNPAAFSSGATDVNDNIASFSSRGPDPFHSWMGLYATGPAVSAPGANIRSSVPGGGYQGGWSGTSMASPHTAGAVGLIISAEPDLRGQVDELQELLRRTAVPLVSTQQCGGVPGSSIPNNTYGWGRIDVKAAVDMVWHAGPLQGTVTDQASGDPIEGARVGMVRNGYVLTTQTDAAGHYEYLLGEGTYTVTVTADGYVPRVQGGIAILQDNPSTLNVPMVRLPRHPVSGTVAEGTMLVPGEPLDALVGMFDTPILVNTDPASGWYTTTPAVGTYWMRTTARGYDPDNRIITVTTALTEDVNLAPRWTYYVRDSRSPCGPTFAWVDATDGTQVCLGDDANTQITPSPTITFTYYGTPYNSFYVGSNGFVSFGTGYSRAHMVFPFEGTPNNAVYGLEEDLNPANCAQGSIYYKTIGNRYVVIEYYQVEHWASGDPETFELIFDTQRGTIKIQYLVVSWPDFTSVGLENEDGTDGVMYSYANSAAITNGLAVGFGPVVGRLPADQGPLGVLGTLSGTVYVTGTATPVPGALVTATSYLNVFTTTAGGGGDYLFPNVCADIYWLTAGDPAYRSSTTAEARLRWSGDVAERDLYLTPLQAAPALTKTLEMAPCGPVTYTIAYANHGDGDITGAVISDVLPAAVEYITSTPPGVVQGNVVTWTMDIPAGGSGEVMIVAALLIPPTRAPEELATNTAYLLWSGPTVSSSAAFDYNLVELHLTKTVAPAAVSPGGLVTYTLAYANLGCDPVLMATLGDVLPAEVAYITSTPPGVYQGGTLTWTVDAGTGQATVVGQLTTTAVPGTQVVNEASLTWAGGTITDTASFGVLEPTCTPVTATASVWSPVAPLVGAAVTFTGTATGTLPITFTWNLGDGTLLGGAVVTHTYALPGTYTVTLTATNCLSIAWQAVRAPIVVHDLYKVYLPLVLRSGP
jgi:uncharacterized repeat protein (TIGR01451 family)